LHRAKSIETVEDRLYDVYGLDVRARTRYNAYGLTYMSRVIVTI
jgi:hypothetical protein